MSGGKQLKLRDHFRTFDGPSVITKRNLGLLRGKTLQEAPHMLVKTPQQLDTESTRRWSIDGSVSPPSTPDSGSATPSSSAEHIGPVPEQRRAAISFGMGGPLEQCAKLWDWPLGEPKVVNCDDYVEVQFNFFPFSAEEVWADVMGNELMIHCKTVPCKSQSREILRCYMLPLNVNPRTAEFSIIQNRYLKVVVRKDLPLKLAITIYGLDPEEDLGHSIANCQNSI